MEIIHYADGSVMTGSRIARALVELAEVLATSGSAASVDIPTREADGHVGRATFLLGPASQIVAVACESEFDEVEDEVLLHDLGAQTRRRRGAEVRAEDQGGLDFGPAADDYESFGTDEDEQSV